MNQNQRSSHFVLGSNGAGYSSVYAKDYVPKEASKPDQIGQNPFRGSSLQHQNGQSYFQTTNKQLMQNWGQVQHSKLDKKQLQNLRSHHFTLGNYNPQSIPTSNNLFYDHKPLNQQASNKQQESKSKMRMHNHDFKQQQWTNFESSYKKEFHKHDSLGPQQQANSNIKSQASNAIVFGNDNNVRMISTNARDFTQKKLDPSLNANIMKSSFQQTSALLLGDSNKNNEPMQTMNQMYYTQKPIEKNQLPEKTMSQLRATHFNLGGSKNNYRTEANLYQPYNSSNIEPKAQIPTYESGTWVDKSAKFDAQSTHHREFISKPVQPYKKHEAVNRGGFQLGSVKTKYETQFSINFAQKDGKDLRAQTAKKPDNIQIGLDKGTYVTQQRANYQPRDLMFAQSNSQFIKQKNQADHFTIGGTLNQAHLTTYQDEYRKDIENKNRMFHNTKI